MNDVIVVGFMYFAGLLLLAGLGFHIAVVLFVLAAAGAVYFLGWPALMGFGELTWSNLNDFLLIAIPLFILMGELMLRSGIAERMYKALSICIAGVPGGLLHTNIGACALFAATSGSSVATTATVGTVALPSFGKRGYSERLVLGSLAAGGALGILIPPSINLILYGAITNTSIGQLFLAGIVPGVLMAGAFSLFIALASILRPGVAANVENSVGLVERLVALKGLAPPTILFLVVMGSMYSGLATPTEAAALGVLASVVLAAGYGQLSVRMLNDAFRATVRTTAMLLLIIVAAFFLNFVFSLIGLPQAIARWIEGLGVTPVATIWILLCLYIVLGCFLETLSMMITTIPITTPLVVALGFDPVWFGIFVVIVCELALITPPVGLNLYVVQGIRGPGKDIRDVMIGALPFIFVILVIEILLIYWPEIALVLPSLAY